MKENINKLNEALRLLRIYSDLSQTEVAKKTGFTIPVVCMLEKGKRKVTAQTLNKYSEVFGISAQIIISFAELLQRNKDAKKEIFEKIIDEVISE